jgi:hypothetical protein
VTFAAFFGYLLQVLPILISLAALIVAVIRTRRSEVDTRFKSGSDRMDAHERRLQSVEQTVTGMPSREDVHRIDLNIERMNGALDRMGAVMEGNGKIMERLEIIVTRHEDHLLNNRSRP